MTEWAAQVRLVQKKYGMLPFCIECKIIHSMKIKDTSRLLMMDEYMDTLGDDEYLMTLEAQYT